MHYKTKIRKLIDEHKEDGLFLYAGYGPVTGGYRIRAIQGDNCEWEVTDNTYFPLDNDVYSESCFMTLSWAIAGNTWVDRMFCYDETRKIKIKYYSVYPFIEIKEV